MIYKELLRVAEIDAEINALHDKLGQLYAERQNIIVSKPVTTTDQLRQAYQLLEEQWGMVGVNIPRFESLQSRLGQAVAMREQMLQDHPNLVDKLAITLVPPQRRLQKSYDAQTDVPTVRLADETMTVAQSQRWTVLLVIEAPQYIADNSLRGFMERQDYLYQDYDCRGLGLQELLAYGLQTGNWPLENDWTLLLKETTDQQVMCAQMRNGELVVDQDDQESLLGRNYFKPAIVING